MPEHYGFYAEHHRLAVGDGYPGDALIDAANEAIDLRAENERLRGALGAILAGLTDALGDPMGARPSQVTTLYSIASHAMRPIHARNKEVDRG